LPCAPASEIALAPRMPVAAASARMAMPPPRRYAARGEIEAGEEVRKRQKGMRVITGIGANKRSAAAAASATVASAHEGRRYVYERCWQDDAPVVAACPPTLVRLAEWSPHAAV